MSRSRIIDIQINQDILQINTLNTSNISDLDFSNSIQIPIQIIKSEPKPKPKPKPKPIPIQVVKTEPTINIISNEDDLICNICFEISDDNKQITINCGSNVPHKLCKKCYDLILNDKPRCPFCMNKISDQYSTQISVQSNTLVSIPIQQNDQMPVQYNGYICRCIYGFLNCINNCLYGGDFRSTSFLCKIWGIFGLLQILTIFGFIIFLAVKN